MSQLPSERRALYLRWRPSEFADVVGQEHVVRTLRNAVATGSLSHAYLFAGPRGTGKTSVARILFRAANCQAAVAGDPCGACPLCASALSGKTLDLIEIDAASNRGIDDIRDLRERIAFSPAEARYRVYIIDEAHELTGPAWDALLKTLEEPPPHAVFVLATTEAHKIPSTIASRCQRFDFRRIRPSDIRDRLLSIAREESIDLSEPAGERLASMARGGLRDAISLLDQAASFTDGKVNLEALRDVLGFSDLALVEALLEAVAEADASRALRQLIDAAESGGDLRLLAGDLVSLLRGLLFAQIGAAGALASDIGPEHRDWVVRMAPAFDPVRLRDLTRAITDGLARIRDSGQLQLHLELAVLEACDPLSAAPDGRSSQTAARGASSPTTAAAGRSLPRIDQPEPSKRAATGQSEAGVLERIAASDESPLGNRIQPPTLVNESSAPGEPPPLDEPPTIDYEYLDSVLSDGGLVVASAEGQSTSSPAGNDLEAVRLKWSGLLDWLRRRSSYIATYLEPAELEALEGDWLQLRFSFKLHHDRVADPRNTTVIEQGLQAVMGRSFKVRCQYVPPATSAANEPIDLSDPVLRFALDKFGGRAEWVDR